MSVQELTTEQKEELRSTLFYGYRYNEDERARYDEVLNPEEKATLLAVSLCFWEIPDELLYKVFEGISFVNDDFFCSAGM